MPRWARAISSATVSGSSSWIAATWSYGATIRCPFVYGNLLRITKQRSPRWTISIASSSSAPKAAQKMHSLSMSLEASFTYSRRHGAQIRCTAESYVELQPAALAEERDHADQQDHHHAGDHVEVGQVALAGNPHVHPPDAGEQGQWQDDDADRGEHAQDVVDPV